MIKFVLLYLFLQIRDFSQCTSATLVVVALPGTCTISTVIVFLSEEFVALRNPNVAHVCMCSTHL